MVSRKYAVRINFCCRSCPTAPSGPEGGAIFHPGDVKLFPFWGPFTNDVCRRLPKKQILVREVACILNRISLT